MKIPENYLVKVQNRTRLKFILGLFPRLFIYIKFSFFRFIARSKGAQIGKNTNLNWKLVKKANSNLIIGDDCAIEASKFDLRGNKIRISDHVIINKNVEIIRLSHFVDDDRIFKTRVYPELIIESYSWLATGCKILPQVSRIEQGVICGAFSVIAKDCIREGVYAGNPAKYIRKHNSVFDNLVCCSLQGGDLKYYFKSFRIKA